MNKIDQALKDHLASGTYRRFKLSSGEIDFSSNDYFGLSRSQKVRSQLVEELRTGCPLGATGSRLLSGHTEYHERVEGFLAKTFEFQSALIFSSGFMANLGVIYTLGTLGATFFSDQLNHASLVDGIRFSKSHKEVYRHNDLSHLEVLLKRNSSELKVIVTESVFSMDGDLAPLEGLVALAEKYEAWLLIDEAHATGLFGTTGLGCFENFKFVRDNVILIHTGGKALGGQGAFVLCEERFRNLLINRARSFIFSTGLAPLSVVQIEYALREIINNPHWGSKLIRNAMTWKRKLDDKFETLQSLSPIIPVVLGSNKKVNHFSSHLKKQGFDVRPIRFPTVAKGSERLRLTIKSFHSPQQLEALSCALRKIKE